MIMKKIWNRNEILHNMNEKGSHILQRFQAMKYKIRFIKHLKFGS